MIEVKAREQEVNGRLYKVPTNVSRVDSATTHGWQCRFKASPSLNKFFSDSKYGGTQLAFIEARNYAQRNRPLPGTSYKKSDVLREVRRVPKGSNTGSHFIEVPAIVWGQAPKRFYIGTDNTYTKARQRKAMSEARAFRKTQVAAHAQHVKELRCKSEAAL